MKTFKFLSEEKLVYNNSNITWKTATGRHIPITWMTFKHMLNVLNCLQGMGNMEIPEYYEGRHKSEWITIFVNELNHRAIETV